MSHTAEQAEEIRQTPRPWIQRHTKRVVKTADLKVGDIVLTPGLHMAARALEVKHEPNGITEIVVVYQPGFHRYRRTIRRKTSGRSTVYVPSVREEPTP